MCDQCRDFNSKKYPDLGDGSFMEITNVQITGMDASEQYLRLMQERDVTYMGMEGAVSRHEIECVYIPWHLVISQVLPDTMELYARGAPESVQLADMTYLAKLAEEQEKRDRHDEN